MKKRSYLMKSMLLPVLAILFVMCTSSTGCTDTEPCEKCIDNKPPATAFSTKLNGINHVITTTQAVTMTQRFNTNADSLRQGHLAAVSGLLPFHETFNLKAIDDLICQPNTIGLRVYLSMDENRKLRLVLVGVDPEGNDLISRSISGLPADRTGEVAIDAGQRWP